jgi:hypothetical protein
VILGLLLAGVMGQTQGSEWACALFCVCFLAHITEASLLARDQTRECSLRSYICPFECIF